MPPFELSAEILSYGGIVLSSNEFVYSNSLCLNDDIILSSIVFVYPKDLIRENPETPNNYQKKGLVIMAESKRKHMIYKKFYMNDEELFNLNQKVKQTHFSRSDYLRLMLRNCQAKEEIASDLKEFYFQLHRLYSPLNICSFMLSSRYKSVSEMLEKVTANVRSLSFEIMDTLAIYERLRSE